MGNYKYLKSEVAPSGGKLGLTHAPDCGAKVHRVVGLKSKGDIRSWMGGGGTGGANSRKMLLLWRNVGRVVGRVEWRLHIGSRGHTPSRRCWGASEGLSGTWTWRVAGSCLGTYGVVEEAVEKCPVRSKPMVCFLQFLW